MSQSPNEFENKLSTVVSRSSSEIHSTRVKLKRRQALLLDQNVFKSNESNPEKPSEQTSIECQGCEFDRTPEPTNKDVKMLNIPLSESPSKFSSGLSSLESRINRPNSMREAIDMADTDSTDDKLELNSDIDEDLIAEDLEGISIRSHNRSQSTENLLSTLLSDDYGDSQTGVLENIKLILNHESRHLELLSAIHRYKYILQENHIQEETIWSIFHNIDELMEAQSHLVSSLEVMILEWDCKRHSFTNLMDLYAFLHKKCTDYARNIPNAVRESKILFDKNKVIKTAISEVVYEGRKHCFENLLAIPTTWLCNSVELINGLLQSSCDFDKTVIEETIQKLKDSNLDPSNIPSQSLIQNSYIRSDLFVEYYPNTSLPRRLRHIFLFSTMLVCAKQKLVPYTIPENHLRSLWGVRVDKFEMKWFIPLNNLVIHHYKPIDNADKTKSSEIAMLKDKIRELKMQLISERDKLQYDSDNQANNKNVKRTMSNNFSLKKMMIKKEMERLCNQIFKTQSELLLLSPSYIFMVSKGNERPHQLLVSSLKDIELWKWSLVRTQRTLRTTDLSDVTDANINGFLDTYRPYKKCSDVATWPMTHDDGLSGILTVHIESVTGLNPTYKYCLSIEVDYFKMMEHKATTKIKSTEKNSIIWNESFDIELDCSLLMIISIYQIKSITDNKENIAGFFEIKLSKDQMTGNNIELVTPMLGNENVEFKLKAGFSLASQKEVLRREPSMKKSVLFGQKISSVVAREHNSIGQSCPVKNVPMILVACLDRIEQEAIDEEGIYRISGSKTEINELYRRFNKNVQNTINNLSNYDLHACTGIVKLYLRELPEPLMLPTNYRMLLEIAKFSEESKRIEAYSEIINNLPEPNRSTVLFLMKHFRKVINHSSKNQMVSGNLGLILGPTLMLPAVVPEQAVEQQSGSIYSVSDIAQETVNSMALAQVFTQIINFYKDDRLKLLPSSNPEL